MVVVVSAGARVVDEGEAVVVEVVIVAGSLVVVVAAPSEGDPHATSTRARATAKMLDVRILVGRFLRGSIVDLTLHLAWTCTTSGTFPTDPCRSIPAMDSARIAASITRQLATSGDRAKKDWWESYLRGVIGFHGVPMGEVRRIVHDAVEAPAEPDEIIDLARVLLQGPIAEQKLAGILLLAEVAGPEAMLGRLGVLSEVFDEGHIFDWNTCDWLCVKVLGPAVAAGGYPAAETLTGWRDAPGLWRRRASMVGLVPVVGEGDAVIPGLTWLTVDTCASHAADDRRFIQTGIGWTMRELSTAEPETVEAFLRRHRSVLSREAVRMAAARLDDDVRLELGLSGPRRRR